MKRAKAKVLTSGRGQIVRIPKEYHLNCRKVFIEREGDRIVLTPCYDLAMPRPDSWKEYFDTAPRLPSDYQETADMPPEEVEEK